MKTNPCLIFSCSEQDQMKRRQKGYNTDDALALVQNGGLLDVSDFSDSSDEKEERQPSSEESESESDASNQDQESDVNDDNDDNEQPPPVAVRPQHVYRWRKQDTLVGDFTFSISFSDPPLNVKSPLEYFCQFFTEGIIDRVVEQTNLYSVQKNGKSIATNKEEIRSLIGMLMKMSIVRMPNYLSYWSRELRYPPVADVMPRNRFQASTQHLHFVDNTTANANDKLTKIRPIIDAVRNEFIKLEPEEYHSIDEQIIPCKTKFSSIRQYNPKKPKKWGF